MDKELGLINSLKPSEFYNIIKEILNKIGFKVIKTEEVEDELRMVVLCERFFLQGKYVIICKKSEFMIGESIIRDLLIFKNQEDAMKGIFITNNIYTEKTKKSSSKEKIELISGPIIAEMIMKEEIPIIKQDYTKKVRQLEEDEATDKELQELRFQLTKVQDNMTEEFVNKKLEIIDNLKKKYNFTDQQHENEVINEIEEEIKDIKKSKYMQKLLFNTQTNKQKINMHLNAIEDSLKILKKEFDEILENNFKVSEKIQMDLMNNTNLNSFFILNLKTILMIMEQGKKAEELENFIEHTIDKIFQEKELAKREAGFELRKLEQILNDLKNEFEEDKESKVFKTHEFVLLSLEKIVNKQIQDINLLKKEISSPGVIKIAGLFSRKKTKDEIREIVSRLTYYLNRYYFYESKIQEVFIKCENKQLLLYKEKILIKILENLVNCKIENEILSATLFDNPVNMVKCWEMIDSLIEHLEEQERLPKDILSTLKLEYLQVEEKKIELHCNQIEDCNQSKAMLEHTIELLENQMKHLENMKKFMYDKINLDVIYIYNFNHNNINKNIEVEDFEIVDKTSILENTEKEIFESQQKRIKTLLSLYRWM